MDSHRDLPGRVRDLIGQEGTAVTVQIINHAASRDYVAFDLENPNSGRVSIRRIGRVTIHDGRITDRISTCINPEGRFAINIKITGITLRAVAAALKLPRAWP